MEEILEVEDAVSVQSDSLMTATTVNPSVTAGYSTSTSQGEGFKILSSGLVIWCILAAIIFVRMRHKYKVFSEEKIFKMLRNSFIWLWIMFVIPMTFIMLTFHSCPVVYIEGQEVNNVKVWFEEFLENSISLLYNVVVISPFLFLIAKRFIRGKAGKTWFMFAMYVANHFTFLMILVSTVYYIFISHFH